MRDIVSDWLALLTLALFICAIIYGGIAIRSMS
jgi:hypothetical protein